MASLDDLKKRIASVKSTQKITKAMKMVAAAKLRRAQESAEKGRPYSEKMNNGFFPYQYLTITLVYLIKKMHQSYCQVLVRKKPIFV